MLASVEVGGLIAVLAAGTGTQHQQRHHGQYRDHRAERFEPRAFRDRLNARSVYGTSRSGAESAANNDAGIFDQQEQV